MARQYCGQLGKQANCQVAVSLSLANDAASLPVAYRLCLPKDWAEDNERRCKAGIPEEIGFKTKPEIALEQIQWGCEMDLPADLVLIDAGYGNASQLRAGITELGKRYVAGIQSQTQSRSQAHSAAEQPRKGAAMHPRRSPSRGLPFSCVRRRGTIEWREGTNERLSSRFARVRVHVGASDEPEKSAEEWLLIEWPEGENEPTKYWLSTLPRNIPFRDLVDAAKLRWRIERDYQELKPNFDTKKNNVVMYKRFAGDLEL